MNWGTVYIHIMISNQKLTLRQLIPEDKNSFIEAVKIFKNDIPPWEFAFHFDEQSDFQEYLEKLENWSIGIDLPENFVPNTFLVGVLEGKIIGRVSIRHRLTDYLERIGGHVGYGVIHSYRRRGFATEMLKQAISVCFSLKINQILVTCDEDNIGSRKVIEKCGGVFENITDYPELEIQKRRYWISSK